MVESTLRLSKESQEKYPEIEWQHIKNFRNRLVHEYFEVDLDLIWRIIQNNLPLLKQASEALLEGTDEPED